MPNLFGGYTNYDAKGNQVGRSEPNLFGGYTNYDNNGRKVGRSDPGLFGGYVHYDSKGNKVGRSDPGLFGGYSHYDKSGRKSGSSSPGMFGGYNHSSGEGCYVATCVYGAYGCPQVWTLRRFRDQVLKKSGAGKVFVRFYYAVSPKLVEKLGDKACFRAPAQCLLDHLVMMLKCKGFIDTPYYDFPKEE